MTTATPPWAKDEASLRLARFRDIGGTGYVVRSVAASTVNEKASSGIRVFYGGRGIWYDAARTRDLIAPGVTVGVLHTGRHYDDDLATTCIEYHYPETQSPGKDAAEVDATKNAAATNVPVFVVVQQNQLRDVYLGWIEDFSDTTRSFLIAFGESAPEPEPENDAPFEATTTRPATRRDVAVRTRDPRFAFRVKQRYGASCAACGLAVPSLIDAAHIVAVSDGGSNDPRNGLALCANHHRAFDGGLFGIRPSDTTLVELTDVPMSAIGVTRTSLVHLGTQPHRRALEMRWEKSGQTHR